MVKIIMVKKMNENLELMMHIYTSAEMGVYTTGQLLELLRKKENKIKHVLECELKEYEKFMRMSKTILEKNEETPKNSGMMAKLSSDMGMKFETMKDNSDPAIAQMLVEGMTMGTVDMTSKIDKYKTTCKRDFIKIARNYLKFQENEIEKLKTFM